MTSERITLHEIKCPNCGATISSFNPFAVACRCPNCDKIFQIVGAAQNPDIPAPERIFPFSVSREQFFERFNAVFWKEFSKAYGEKVRTAAQFGEISAFYVVAYLPRLQNGIVLLQNQRHASRRERQTAEPVSRFALQRGRQGEFRLLRSRARKRPPSRRRFRMRGRLPL